jgi:nucleoside-diphosphate-sugar epimerase
VTWRVFAASLALTDVHESVNLARGTTTRIVDLAAAAMRAAGTERPLRLHAAPTNAGVAVRRASAGRLHEILPGLAPFLSLEDGLARTVAWYRDVLR